MTKVGWNAFVFDTCRHPSISQPSTPCPTPITKLDLANIMIACIECDSLFEIRDIIVNVTEQITAGDRQDKTPDLKLLLDARVERRAPPSTRQTVLRASQRPRPCGLTTLCATSASGLQRSLSNATGR
jgi:hypothetical protein